MKGSVGRKKQVARELHGESRCALHSPARLDVSIRRTGDSPHVYAPVTIAILILNRNQGIAQYLRIIVVGSHHSSLQCERANDAALPVVKFGDGTGTVMLQLLDLGKVGGIDQQQAGGSAYES